MEGERRLAPIILGLLVKSSFPGLEVVGGFAATPGLGDTTGRPMPPGDWMDWVKIEARFFTDWSCKVKIFFF